MIFGVCCQAEAAWQHTAALEGLPADRGSYLLGLEMPEAARVQIGRLGSFDFPAGVYFYAGSAHGPGGIKARVLHHACSTARPRWHLDFLRAHALLWGGWVVCENGGVGSLECRWSQALAGMAGAWVARGFGAADCHGGCQAHLVGFAERPGDALIKKLLTIPRSVL